MFSYSGAVKKLVIPEIYNRGIKLYLEGKVVNKKPLTIDNWRQYTVLDSINNYVKTPILHLVLGRKNYSKIDLAITESCSCSCQYFVEFGVCRHIVAVFASLEKEFFDLESEFKLESQIQTSILENIFAVEQQTKIRNLQSNLDTYFLKPLHSNFTWWEKFIFENQHEPKLYKEFVLYLKRFLIKKLKEFDYEKKILNLATSSISLDGKFWWLFWIEILGHFTPQNQHKFWREVWKLRSRHLTQDFDTQINNYVSSLEDEQKNEIFEMLKSEFENNHNLWLDFVISSKFESFLESNLDSFDPDLLIQIAEIIPEQREKIEIKMMNKTKIWSDFMPTGDYQELMNLLDKWAIFGRSDYFDETVKYIKEQHKKKTKLNAFLRKLGY